MGGCCAKVPVLTLPEDDVPVPAPAPRRPPLPPNQFSPRRGRSCAPARVTANQNQYQPLAESTPQAQDVL